AKLANSTVNHRNRATSPANTFCWRVLVARSRTNSTVVSTEPTSTMNITGLRIIRRGWSLRSASPIAPRTMVRSKIERDAGSLRRTFGGRSATGCCICNVAVIGALLDREVFEDRAEGERGEERQAGDDDHHADEQPAEQRGVRRQGAAGGRHLRLAGQRGADGQGRDDQEEPAD